jgi:Pyridoxal-dependent decarboxylase conserved domain
VGSQESLKAKGLPDLTGSPWRGYVGVCPVCPEMRHHFDGLELADSFVTNPHKWLLTQFDCSALWVKDARRIKDALSLTPEYLRAPGNELDYKVCQFDAVMDLGAPPMTAQTPGCLH